jgi:hypothetical protein
VGVAVALLACVGLAACTATEPPSPASTAEADTIAPFPESGWIDAGTYLVTGYPVPFEITVPDGWETFDGASLGKDDPNPDLPNSWNVALLFYPATYVPTDACAWKGALVKIDPTAEAFVDAMTAQASTVSTPAVEVMVGDYAGFEFDHSVESGVDITDCDDGTLCIASDSAQDCNGTQYPNAGMRETYRAVDLNGERAVIRVSQSQESIDPAMIKEGRAIFDSIVFVGPDQ